MRKKILFVRTLPYYQNPNSYNSQPIGLGRAFVKLGYDYDFICPKEKEEKTWVFCERDGCVGRCLEMKKIRFLRWGFYPQILNQDALSQYDMIISQEYYQPMTYLLGRISHKVVMYNGPYYNMFMFKFFSPIYDLFMTKRMDLAVSVKFVKSVLSQEFLERKGYHNVINVGVGLDTDRFDNAEPPTESTSEICRFMESNRCMLYIGNLMDRKNYPFMLKLYESLLEDLPDLKFVVIGKSKIGPFAKLFGGKDTDYESNIKPTIPEHVTQGIYRVEKIDNPQLKYIYPLAKAFILPSKKEIFGMVLPEAMYLGAPVVTTKNGGSMTLIDGCGTGVMLDNFDVMQWKQAVLGIINDRDNTKRITGKASVLIKNNYTWLSIAQKMIERSGLL